MPDIFDAVDEVKPDIFDDVSAEKEDLRRQMREARAEAIGNKALSGLANIGERAAYTASLMEPLKVLGNVINPYHQTIVSPEQARSVVDYFDPLGQSQVGSFREGAKQFVAETGAGLTAPEAIVATGTGKIPFTKITTIDPRLPGTLFQPSLIQSSPEAVNQLTQAQTPAEFAQAGLNTAMAVAAPVGIAAHQGYTPRVVIPDIPGTALRLPEGAKPTRVEPPAGVELKQPELVEVSPKPAQPAPLPEIKAIAAETKVEPEVVEKGIRVEAEDHPKVAESNPELLPTLVKDELKLDKKAYDKDADPGKTQPTNEQPTVPELDIKPTEQRRIPSYGEKYIRELGPEAARKRIEHLNARTAEELAQRPINQNAIRNLQQEAQNIANALDKLPPEPTPAPAPGEEPTPTAEPAKAQPQPPAVTEAKPSGVGEKMAQLKKEISNVEKLIRSKDKKMGVMTPPPIRAEVMGKLNQRLGKLQDELAKLEPTPTAKPTAEPQKGIVGMGGAVPSEFERGQGSPTAMKYRLIDEERQKRGEPALAKPQGRSDQVVMDKAMAEMDKDPTIGERLVAELNQKPRAIQDWENHVLLLRKIDLREEYNKAAREAAQAYEDSTQFPERLADMNAASQRVAIYGDKLAELEKASRLSGSERGRALRSLQVMANEDYSLAALETAWRRDHGWQRPPLDVVEKLKGLADKWEKTSKEYEQKVKDLEAADTAKEAQWLAERSKMDAELEAAKAPKYHPKVLEMAEGYAKSWDERGKAALSELKALWGGEGQMLAGPLNPEILDKLVIYGVSKAVRGAVDFAKWTDSMVKDLGPKFAEHAKDVWDRVNKELDLDLASASKKFGKHAKEVIQKIKKPASPVDEVGKVRQKIQRKLTKNDEADITFLLRKLAKNLWESGVKDRDALLNEVHAVMKEVVPDMTMAETRDALSGRGRYRLLSKKEVDVALRDYSQQWQQIGHLEDMAAGKAPPRSGFERQPPSDEGRALLKQVQEAKRQGGYTVTDPEIQLKSALAAVKTRLTNDIADLEKQIATREKIVKNRTKLQYDEEALALKARKAELQEQFDTIFPKQPITEAERLARWKERTREKLEETREKVRLKDFARKPRPEPVKMDNEAIRLRYELHQVERQIHEMRALDKLKQQNAAQKALRGVSETVNTLRAILTSGEFSGVLRQGGIVVATNPVRAAKIFPDMFKAFASERAQFRVAEELRNRPNAPLYELSKLYLAEHGGRLSQMEEAYMSRWAEQIPVLGPFVRSSARAYTTFLNKLRADTFDAMVASLSRTGEVSIPEAKVIANYINVATGRGSVGFDQAAVTLNTVFFAPRFVASRFQYLAGQPLWTWGPGVKGTSRARKAVAQEYAKALIGATVVYGLAKLAGATISTDSNSSDFMKIKFGNTRIDPMAGLIQPVVLGSRLATGKTTTLGGKSYPIHATDTQKVPYGKDDAGDVMFRFVRSKLSPAPGLAMNLLSGQDVIGQPYSVSKIPQNMMVPITYQDIYQVMKEQGLPDGAIMSILAVFGMGIQTYNQQKKTAGVSPLLLTK